MKYRKGDKVSIVGIIKHTPDDDADRIFIAVPDYHADIWVSQKVVTLVQADFEVGDKCQWGGTGECLGSGTVLAISDGHAWIDLGGGDYCTRLLTKIERIEEDDQSAV